MADVATDLRPTAAYRPAGSAVDFGSLLVPFVLIGFANGDYAKVAASLDTLGLLESLYATFQISIVVWVGMWQVLDLLSQSTLGPTTRRDGAVLALVGFLFLWPISSLAWAGLALLAVYLLLVRATDDVGRRAAWVILALSVTSQWAPMVFKFLTDWILLVDTVLVATVSGSDYSGNLVFARDGKTVLNVLAGCSSFANLSLAFLGWIMARAHYGTRGLARSVLFLALSGTLVVAINTIRIGIIALRPDLYDLAHGSVGANIASLLTTASIAAVSLYGARR
ncbi:hypothetical protein [Prosthecomicrobium sp. N25]|uniref:hypothetical protein n=1 Tax=Prosthecomicrobium sp. N25 TaxID=3129254 RepID=UPI003077EDD2